MHPGVANGRAAVGSGRVAAPLRLYVLTMVFEIRPGEPDDAAGIAAVWAAAMPHLVKTAAAFESELRTSRARRVLVAVENGKVVGHANAWRTDTGDQPARVRLGVQVPPADRGRGIGAALATAITDVAVDLGAKMLLTVVADDDDARAFATRRGFSIGRELSHSRADLADTPDPVPAPHDLRVVSYDAVEPHAVWKASAAVAAGDPSGLSGVPAYDEWLATEWESPDLRRDLSIALVAADPEAVDPGAGEVVVSFVTTTADPNRGVIWSNLTGTVPAYRGRGLAKVVKSAALRRARDAGFTAAFTGNDAGNAPMLAVNQWLGYRPATSSWTAEKAV